ncbi:hypothetical protein TB2_039789 [Malus domestica]
METLKMAMLGDFESAQLTGRGIDSEEDGGVIKFKLDYECHGAGLPVDNFSIKKTDFRAINKRSHFRFLLVGYSIYMRWSSRNRKVSPP